MTIITLTRAAVLLLCIQPLRAFDIDGFRSGMSIEEANALIATRKYSRVTSTASGILLFGATPDEFWSLSFRANRLMMLQKNLVPDFRRFTEVVQAFREEHGKPIDVFVRSADPLSKQPESGIHFLWDIGADDLQVSYWPSQLNVVYRKKEPNSK